jgi:hypothetical protein
MKGTVAFVVIALAATWAVLFLPTTKPSQPRAKPASSAHAATPAPPQQAVPSRAKPNAPEPDRPEAVAPAAPAAPDNAMQRAAPSQGDVRIIGGSASATAKPAAPQPPKSSTQLSRELGDRVEYREPTGELGEGVLSPDYKLMEESYIEEARDGPWATQQELRIRNLLIAGNLGERIVLISCQSSVCRVHLEPHGQDPYGELLGVPGLAAALGIDTATPYSLNSAELIVYAKPEAIPDALKR